MGTLTLLPSTACLCFHHDVASVNWLSHAFPWMGLETFITDHCCFYAVFDAILFQKNTYWPCWLHWLGGLDIKCTTPLLTIPCDLTKLVSLVHCPMSGYPVALQVILLLPETEMYDQDLGVQSIPIPRCGVLGRSEGPCPFKVIYF